MAIDILFLIMATFGFYFGYTFGLMRLALILFSFLFATIAAMSFTPMTSSIIRETFEVESVFLPFAAFGITLLIVLMLARMVTKLIEETLVSQRFDVLSRLVGGLLMALWFTLLYSVLVIFFGKSGIFPLVFNEDRMVSPEDRTVHIGVPAKAIALGPTDTLWLSITNDPNLYPFEPDKDSKGGIALSLGFVPMGNGIYQAYINNKGRSWNLLQGDTAQIQARRELVLTSKEKMLCFCDSSFIIYPQDTTLLFDCTDPNIRAKSATSLFYPYIEIIPQRGNQLMNGLRPLIREFVDYMDVALERVEKRPLPDNTIQTYDEEKNRQRVEPDQEEVTTPSSPELQTTDQDSL